MIQYTLAYTNIYVSDFARAFRFYSETLGLKSRLKDEKFGYASFDTKGT